MICSYYVVVSPGSSITVETQDASPSPLLPSPEPGGAVVVTKEVLEQYYGRLNAQALHLPAIEANFHIHVLLNLL